MGGIDNEKKLAAERTLPDRELDFVLSFDAVAEDQTARLPSEGDLRASVHCSRGFKRVTPARHPRRADAKETDPRWLRPPRHTPTH